MIQFITGMLVGWAVRKQSEKLYRQRQDQKRHSQQMQQQARSPGRDWEVWQQIMRVRV